MAAPPSAGVAVSEQERLVALILVLTRDPFLSNPRRSLAGRDSLGLSLEGCEPIGPLASKLCTITPGFRLLLPPPPRTIPGVGRSIRSRCHSDDIRPCWLLMGLMHGMHLTVLPRAPMLSRQRICRRERLHGGVYQ